MSFASKVLYTGDGIVSDFNVPMPYISQTDVSVFVNEILQLTFMNYNWSGPSTVSFTSPPGAGDAIEIRRWTSPTALLVDFVDGSVLNANDLDTAYQHNFYLSQEYADSFNEVINSMLVRVATAEGISATDPDQVILELVASMISSASASNLLARITDIDDNAEAIITLGESLQVQLNNLVSGSYGTNLYYQAGIPVPGVAGVSDPIPQHSLWIDTDDGDKEYIYITLTWVEKTDTRLFSADTYINALEAEYGANASSFINVVTAIASVGLATASEVSLLGVSNGADTAFILDSNTVKVDSDVGDTFAEKFTVVAANAASVVTHTSAISGIEAEYGVTLNVNGYVSGFKTINTGVGSSAFIILADKFAIVDASGDSGETEYVPFEISGGKINFRADVKIDGNLMVTGTINGGAMINGTIGSTQIGANAITTTQLNANSVTAVKILANAITAEKINVTNLAAVSANMGILTVDSALTMGTGGHIKGGQTAYDTGSGFFLGYSSGYKFSIGDGAANKITWDGSTMVIRGDLVVGNYVASDVIFSSADTLRSNTNGWTTKKQWTVNNSGTIRVWWEDRYLSAVPPISTNSAVRVRVNGVVKYTKDVGSGSFIFEQYDATVVTGDVITIQTLSGSDDIGDMGCDIRNARLKADLEINPTATLDIN